MTYLKKFKLKQEKMSETIGSAGNDGFYYAVIFFKNFNLSYLPHGRDDIEITPNACICLSKTISHLFMM